MSTADLLKPARRSAESMAEYRRRRLRGQAYVKRALKGRVLWNSMLHGTYRSPA